MPTAINRLGELFSIIAVGLTILATLIGFAVHISERMTLLEERVVHLQHDNDKFSETSLPVMEARLDRQRADLDQIANRLEKYCRPDADR